MQVKSPLLSVIIATHERAQEVARLMADLGAQESVPPFEVLICDDGSCSETLQRLDSTCHAHGATLLTQEDRGFRVASARNMGIRRARHEIAVFLDDDIRVLPNFLREHSRIHSQETSPIALIGPRLNVPKHLMASETGELAPLTSVLQDDRGKKYGISFKDDRLRKARCPWKVVYTCNVSAQLSDLRAVGGFDESFVGYGLEDNELAYRLFKSGVQFVASHRIPVFHEKSDNPTDPFKKATKGMPADFTSYVENAKRFIETHKDDPDVEQVLRQALEAIEQYLHHKEEGPWRGYQVNIW